MMQSRIGIALIFLAQGLMAEPASVTVQPLSSLLQTQQMDAPAQVEALNTPRLSAEIQAQVLSIPVSIGAVVSADQLLVELDCYTYDRQLAIAQASVRRSQANLEFARNQLKRAENLGRKQSISEELRDQRRAELAGAEADYQTARQQAELASQDQQHCQVKAPFDAVVTHRLVSEGDYAIPGQALIGLSETRRLEVSARLREPEIQTLRQGRAYRFVSAEQEYPLTLERILPVLDPASLTAEVRLVFATASKALPGSAGRLQWQSAAAQLPASLLIRRDDKLGVFLAEGNRAVFKVLPKAVEGRPVLLDLPGDSLLVMEGRQALQDGDQLLVSDSAPASPQ